MKLAFSDIQKAQARLAPYIKKTPVTKSVYFSRRLGARIFFKREHEQEIKSFKIRGALNKILSLTKEERAGGLIAASAGNHAQGVALAAKYLNIKARVVMMEKASKVKAAAARKLGAEVILKGKNYDESYKYAQSIAGAAAFIHPFDDPEVAAGQGTAGLEILESLPDLNSAFVSVGGGGLLSGVSLALKSLKPSIKVYGAAWEGTPDFCRNFNNIQEGAFCLCGKNLPPQPSKSGLTDGIAVKKSSRRIVNFCSSFVDGISCVSEQDISECIALLREKEGLTVEGSGAAALAGLLKHHKKWNLGRSVCVVISGANIDQEDLSQALRPRES